MNINADSLIEFSRSDSTNFDKEGRLFVYLPKSRKEEKEKHYNECLCKLRGNLLFLLEVGPSKTWNIGCTLLVLNSIDLKVCGESEFCLSNNRKYGNKVENYYFVCDSNQSCKSWINAIYLSSFEIRKKFKNTYLQNLSSLDVDDADRRVTLNLSRTTSTTTIDGNRCLVLCCEQLLVGSSTRLPHVYLKVYLRNVLLDKCWSYLGQTETVHSRNPFFSRCFVLPSGVCIRKSFEFKFELHLVVQLESECSTLCSILYTQLNQLDGQIALNSLRAGNIVGFLQYKFDVPYQIKRRCSFSHLCSVSANLKKPNELHRIGSLESLPQSIMTSSMENLPSTDILVSSVNFELFDKPIYRKFCFKVFERNVDLWIEEVLTESRSTLFIPQIILKLISEAEGNLISLIKKFAESNPSFGKIHSEMLLLIHTQSSVQLKEWIEQIIKYRETWSFRPSRHKEEVHLQTIPLNLHKQTFRIKAGEKSITGTMFTVGAYTCHHLGFDMSNMLCLVRDNSRVVNTWALSKKVVKIIKYKQIISKQINKLADFLQSDPKENDRSTTLRSMYQTVLILGEELLESFSIAQVERLCSQIIQLGLIREELEPIDLIFLNIKACLVTISDRITQKLQSFKDYDSCNRKLETAIDSLQKVALTCYASLFIGLNEKERQILSKIRFRNLSVITQALTSLIIFLMDRVVRDNVYLEQLYKTRTILIQQTSLLNCFGSECEMLADTVYAINELNNSVKIVFQFDADSAHASIPDIQFLGEVTKLIFHLPKPASAIFKGVAEFDCRLLYLIFNVGITTTTTNSTQSLWPNFQEDCNRANFHKLKSYIDSFHRRKDDNNPVLDSLLEEFRKEVFGSNDRNIAIPRLAEALTVNLSGVRVTNCKSAKDRAGMSVTLEEARVCLRLLHLEEKELDLLRTILDTLRREGVRIENAFKNIGLRKYAFDSSLRVLPTLYQPPVGINQTENIET